MNKEILKIRLAQEAKNWDEMVDRIDEYLKSQQQTKLQKKSTWIDKAAEEEKQEKDGQNNSDGNLINKEDINAHIDENGLKAKLMYDPSLKKTDDNIDQITMQINSLGESKLEIFT